MTTPTKLAVVTASIDPTTTKPYWESWWAKASLPFDCYWTFNTANPRDLGGFMDWFVKKQSDSQGNRIHIALHDGVGGVVPMFAKGVRAAVEGGADIIACFHDDLRLDDHGWDITLIDWFQSHPKTVLAGFGGALRLGQPDMYERPYDPMTLARHSFYSNMEGAEAHGTRSTFPVRVTVLDGFSQIGRGPFMKKAWEWLDRSGIIHHAYDAALGALAGREGGEVWMLPTRVHHHGGLTAVANAQYQEWARGQHPSGDGAFWEMAHKIVWEEFKDILPLGY